MKNKKEVDYLTEEKLFNILNKYYDVERQFKINGTRYKCDMIFEHEGKKYAVEFDGDSHFIDIAVMDRDITKTNFLWNMGYRVIRIPYFIQLDDYTFDMFFRFEYPESLPEVYPHGFIDKRAKTPAYFSSRGMDNFLKIMWYTSEKYNYVFSEIISSMVSHPKGEKDFSYVIPKNLGYGSLKDLCDYLLHTDNYGKCAGRDIRYKKFINAKFKKDRHEVGLGWDG